MDQARCAAGRGRRNRRTQRSSGPIQGDDRSFVASERLSNRCISLVRGDGFLPSLSAASVVAKVARDRWMVEVAHQRWPEYHFNDHKGYGTKKHREALKRFGPCPIHRRSYKPIQELTHSS
mmetsp:Transcript_6709/g.13621  ORF Transcript_6709/g.13621 Transcript_6709/m.13621 type:complete len:121 (-) Transcript_6709:855-1217(-)